ncbi:MAG: SurA N-terminal domain-containing protein [Sphaerochaetaceae bacterium]|jgi:parvulin-like peptidyl-prolyl isomerase|nr:SurA N-terminal domain-containing protein [Sphaerochaetaceae bacterium]NLV84299.1 hypothetical protein [Spirochaetales bacterium]
MSSKETNNAEADREQIVEFKPVKVKRKQMAEADAASKKDQGSPKKKLKVTPAQVFTYVILVVLVVVLVFGMGVSMFGVNRSGGDSLVFGEYDGTPIEFKFGNYFHRQYQNQASQIKDTSISGAYQIWYGAYQNTVFHTALSKLADKAGIVVAENSLNEAIKNSGAFSKDGVFDPETYKNATVEYQTQVKTSIQDNLPAQMVLGDVMSVLTSDAEIDYVLAMNDNGRSFNYVAFTAESYPDDLTAAYAQANPALFTQIDISIITMQDEAALKTLAEELQAGSKTFADAAVANSIDTFASEGGRAGVWYLYELQQNFNEPDQVNVLFSTKEGSVSQVFASPSGFTLYKVEKSPALADFTDVDVLADVKTYIGSKDPAIVSSYLQEKASEFYQAAANGDFASVAEQFNVNVVEVGATPANIGESSYLSSFAYTDYQGALASVATGEEAMKKLYSAAVGTVIEPLISGNNVIVAKVMSEEPIDENTKDYLRYVYPYMAQNQIQQDLAQSIFASDKLKDDFFNVFLTKVMGEGSAN